MIRMIRQSVFFLELIKMEVAQPFKLRFQKGHDSESDFQSLAGCRVKIGKVNIR